MLCSNTTLTSLDLSYNTIGNTGALSLAGAQNTTLTNLNVQMNHVSHDVKITLQTKIAENIFKLALIQNMHGFGPDRAEEMKSLTRLPHIVSNTAESLRPHPEPVAAGVFNNDGNSRFQQAVLDRCDVRQNRSRLPVKTNKYSLDLV